MQVLRNEVANQGRAMKTLVYRKIVRKIKSIAERNGAVKVFTLDEIAAYKCNNKCT